ncbi:MAG: dTDP-glucose 4,6-dehydratase [Deltaproteobacteria bacterium]|jgi:dTDP-glucose 4,6-dehydratase|nr:dTDP-glucose 4,6-dehydratase [Deltaproteobacteria bacterium]
MKSILITGGAGFIGSNFVPYFLNKYPDYRIINLDKLTYAGSLDNLQELNSLVKPTDSPKVVRLANYVFIQGDICNFELVSSIFEAYDIRGVIHFAAESHVDNSINNPRVFVETNVVGTFNLLQAAYKHWMGQPGQYKADYENCRFHNVSTDEVYGSLDILPDVSSWTENSKYAPNSPYAATKAAADFLARSYYQTYGINITTSNCSNNYGPKQHSEKLIPTIIRKCLAGEAIPIYGKGENVRDWLYVLDHCKAIDLIFHKGRTGETYNVGGVNEKNNLEVVQIVCELLDNKLPRAAGKYSDLIIFVADRPGHDLHYAIDATKLKTELGWQAKESFETGMAKTLDWYLEALHATPQLERVI